MICDFEDSFLLAKAASVVRKETTNFIRFHLVGTCHSGCQQGQMSTTVITLVCTWMLLLTRSRFNRPECTSLFFSTLNSIQRHVHLLSLPFLWKVNRQPGQKIPFLLGAGRDSHTRPSSLWPLGWGQSQCELWQNSSCTCNVKEISEQRSSCSSIDTSCSVLERLATYNTWN